ncbi:MAG: hypothetical protein LAT62_07870 [Natronospirillum sp.]|uniref:hypothetical protein n=1 Tax=Natronospirillum sp. TaxID=2812955 RepID=UPI0025D6D68A|nr:hypothetical protein [Natronospirillum sp.]MCH8551837.1 hypothetical protein [Natronospirillum sp.]
MKSIKLASGFAVSALALAIAGQAAAETTTEVDFTGSVKVNTMFDLENDTRINGMPGYASDNDDWFNLEATWSVSNGPFSGDLIVGLVDENNQNGAGNDGPNGRVHIDNLMVEEGPISFGQVGSVVNTAGLMEGLTDYAIFDALGAEELDLSYGVDGAFRYSVDEFGLQVQGEGTDAGVFGFGAGITQDLDVATVWADFQYREAVGADGMEDGETFFGVAAEVSPIDLLTLTAVFNTESASEQSALGLKVDVQATDDISVYAQYVDVDLGDEIIDESDFVGFGLVAAFAPITFEANYQAWVEEIGEGILDAEVSYAEGPWGAFAGVELGLGGEATTPVNEYFKLEVGGDYTTDSGIKYGSKFTNTSFESAGFADVGESGDAQTLELFAQYSF